MGSTSIRGLVSWCKFVAENKQITLILTSIAVLFELPDSPPTIKGQDLEGALAGPLNISQAPGGAVVISSTRDQIEVHVSGNKVDIRELSGKPEQAQAAIPKLVSTMLSILNSPTVSTYGVNFITEFDMPDPEVWIGEKFLRGGLSPLFDFAPKPPATDRAKSNAVAIRIENPPKDFLVKVESRANARININLNASEHVAILPSADQLAIELKQYYGSTIALIESLRQS